MFVTVPANNRPIPSQPHLVGEFLFIQDDLYCRLCGALGWWLYEHDHPPRVSCRNPECPQHHYHYEPPLVYLEQKP